MWDFSPKDIFQEDISPERHFLKDKISKDIFSEDRNPGTFSQGQFLKDIHIRIHSTVLNIYRFKFEQILPSSIIDSSTTAILLIKI